LPAAAVWAGNSQTAPTRVEQALLGNFQVQQSHDCEMAARQLAVLPMQGKQEKHRQAGEVLACL